MEPDHFKRNGRYVLLGCGVLSCLTTFMVFNPISWRLDQPPAFPAITSTTNITSKTAIAPLTNRSCTDNGTLGFGAIYALSLPERSDKQDSLQLAASLTGLDITWVDGVHGSNMDTKAIPPAHTDPNAGMTAMTSDGALGCWRGHMNAIRDIVRRGLSSALIIEDDADWDVRIVQQMQQFALASNKVLKSRPYSGLRKTPLYSMPDSPYGDDWDILWVGHCGGWAPQPKFQNIHDIIHGDITAPPAFDTIELNWSGDRNGMGWLHDDKDVPRRYSNERIVQYNGRPLCTTAYAVSQQGARKMLAHLGGSSLLDADEHIDVDMTQLCSGDKDTGDVELMRCVIPSPPYFLPHKPRGRVIGDSDREDLSNNDIRQFGESRGLVWSTRLNMKNLVSGLEPVSQYILDSSQWRHKHPEEYELK